MKRASCVSAVLCLAACATIRIDGGGVNEITHTGGATEAKELADRACHRAGSGHGEVISTVNKDASLPPGTGRQVTTFRCTSGGG